jgi:hypothetical protein
MQITVSLAAAVDANGANATGYQFRLSSSPVMLNALTHTDLALVATRTFNDLPSGQQFYADVKVPCRRCWRLC